MSYDPKKPIGNDQEVDEVLAFVEQLRRKNGESPLEKPAAVALPSDAEEETSPFRFDPSKLRQTSLAADPAPVAAKEASPAPAEEETPAAPKEEAPAPRSLWDIVEENRQVEQTEPTRPEKREEKKEKPPVSPKNAAKKKEPLGRRILHALIPFKGDSAFEIGRKLLLLAALVVFIASGSMLFNETVIIPQQNERTNQEIANIRNGQADPKIVAEADAYTGYPAGISYDMKTLYYLNNDVRGWLTYAPCGVNQVVMYSRDNDYYLRRDYFKNNNKNGSLFFDGQNNLDTAESRNKSLVIYGHNMDSGQMFGRLDYMALSLDRMKQANVPIKLDTLFSSAQYKIFAVVMQDAESDIKHYYSIQATKFSGDADFMRYVEGLRARSLYDFPDIDVVASDEILILYTCVNKKDTGMEEGRLAVVARKVRPGEDPKVNSANVVNNEDVIMPYVWYEANGKPLHSYYVDGVIPTSPTSPVTPTEPTPTDPTPTEPIPTEPGPTEPTPTVPTPTVPGPIPPTFTKLAPTEPTPTDPTPTEPIPTEDNPTEPTPTEPTPTEDNPTEPGPTEDNPTEPIPTEDNPTEPTPTEPVPTEDNPTEPAPTEPAPTEPAPTEPAPTEPASTEPATE